MFNLNDNKFCNYLNGHLVMRFPKLIAGAFAASLSVFGLNANAADKPKSEGAFANYMSSGNGESGGYVSFSGMFATSLDDLETSITSGAGSSKFEHGTPTGGVFSVGYDWGKVRFDLRVGGMHADVDTIDNVSTLNGSESAVGFSTLNVSYDLYQFDIHQYGADAKDSISITPFVGGGVGAALGWTNGKQNVSANGLLDRDKFDAGMAYSGEAGVYIGFAPWVGVNVSYNYLAFDLGDSVMNNHTGLAGLRFTY